MPTTSRSRAHRGWSWAVLLTLVSMLLWAPPAYADGDLSWSLAPVDNDHGTGRPNFSYVLEPGTEITDAVLVRNRSATELTLQVYAADGFTTTSGDLDLLPAGQPSVDLGSWTKPAVSELRLAPGAVQEVAFTIVVPADARPGDHPGGIVTSHTTEAGTVQVDQRFGLRIFGRVPGELTVAGAVTDVQTTANSPWNPFAATDAHLQYAVTNAGNARTFFTYRADLSGPFGLGGRSVSGETTEILPGSTLRPELDLPGLLPLFFLSGDLHLTPQAVDGQVGQEIVVPLQVWSIPWGGLGLLLLVTALAVTIGVIRARRTWEWEDEEDLATDQQTTENIAESSATGADPAPAERDSHDRDPAEPADPAVVGTPERSDQTSP